MTDRNSSGGSNLSPSLLTVLFIGLKLTGYINWPWIWVLSPIWISFALAGAILLVVVVLSAIIDR